MAGKSFSVCVTKELLTFSAAHFITFGDNICESLHGHNYGVRCEVAGDLNEHGYVADFIAVRDRLTEITRSLDHQVLLPTQHPSISVQTDGPEVVAKFEQRRWVFPKEDCQLLPMINTTAELLAAYLVDQMLAVREKWCQPAIRELRIGVDENQGQWGVCAISIGDSSTSN